MTELDLTFVDQTVERLGRRRRRGDSDPPGDPGALPLPAARGAGAGLRDDRDHARGRSRACRPSTRSSATGRSGGTSSSVCHGTACHVKGAELIQDAFERRLEIADGDDTDAAGLFTIEKVACLGCCTLAPVVQIDGVTYGQLTPTTVRRRAGRLPAASKRTAARPAAACRRSPRAANVGEIRVGLGSCCVAQGSGKVHRGHRADAWPRAARRPSSSASAAWACATRRRWSS